MKQQKLFKLYMNKSSPYPRVDTRFYQTTSIKVHGILQKKLTNYAVLTEPLLENKKKSVKF
jgi:hypothetical protein